uniref:Uncharacterized protein n=1 Tax=Meloidogyne enterolobii TaxID=390850 RepID=A0A6V7WUU2_MELEN|nr:unnamed protein product [Meloidogyne enterolobii]
MEQLKNFKPLDLHDKLRLSDNDFDAWLEELGLLHGKRTCHKCGGRPTLRVNTSTPLLIIQKNTWIAKIPISILRTLNHCGQRINENSGTGTFWRGRFGATRFGAAGLARLVWRGRFGASRFGACRFGAGVVLAPQWKYKYII